jgi:hypothetical protein
MGLGRVAPDAPLPRLPIMPKRSGGWPRKPFTMIAKSLRAKVVDEVRRDAAAYYREFRSTVGAEPTDWVKEAGADLRRDLKLPPETADQLWPPTGMRSPRRRRGSPQSRASNPRGRRR